MTLDFSPVWAGWEALATGAATTIEVTACSLVLGCVLGLLVGIGRLAPQRVAIRVTAAFRSRKCPGQVASRDVAKRRNCSCASLLNVIFVPFFRANCSSS